MSEREQPHTPDELRERRTQARQQRRGKYFRRARNTVLGAVGTGVAAFAADRGLDKQEAADRQTTQDVAPLVKNVEEAKAANDARDARVQEAIERARASAEAGEPAPRSGVIEVDEAGTTGYVDLDSPHPEDTTPADGTGGISVEDGPDTGGVSPDSTS